MSANGDRGRTGATALFGAVALGQGLALVRYTLLARLLGPEQMGLVAVIMLVGMFMEAISDTGADRFLVQDRQGDEPALQRLIHAVLIARGAICALGFLVAALPLSLYYGEPSLASALSIAAVAPLLEGLQHTDFKRSQRDRSFAPEAKIVASSELVAFVVTLTAAAVTGSYLAVVYGLVARSITLLIASHMVAHRNYAVGAAAHHAQRMFSFSAPLVLNGVVLFVAGQSDRFLIGDSLGLESLGRYSSAILLVLYPTAMLQKALSTLHLPELTRAQQDPAGSALAGDRLGGQTLVLSVGVTLGFTVIAPFAVVLLYGHEFVLPGAVFAAISMLQASRFFRFWPSTIAVSRGDSRIVLLNNVVRMAGLPIAALAFALTQTLLGITIGFILGELLAMIAAFLLLGRHGAPSAPHWVRRVATLIAAGAIGFAWQLAAQSDSLTRQAVVAAASTVLVVIVAHHERRTLHETAATALKLMQRIVRRSH